MEYISTNSFSCMEPGNWTNWIIPCLQGSERKTCNWSHYNTNNLNLQKISIYIDKSFSSKVIVHQCTGTSMVELENTNKNCVNATLTIKAV